MNHSRLLLLLAQLLLPGMAAAAAIDGTAPYPASTVLTGFKLDSATVRGEFDPLLQAHARYLAQHPAFLFRLQ